MNYWKVSWMDGSVFRSAIIEGYDIYAVGSKLSMHGCHSLTSIIKIERVDGPSQ